MERFMPGFLKKLINSGLISAAVCAAAAPAAGWAASAGARDAESAFEEEDRRSAPNCRECMFAGAAVLLVSEARKIMAGSVYGATERDACAILAKALEMGSADAASELGRAYLRGFGVKYSESTGLRLLRKGTEGGSALGARYLADYYFDHDDPDLALAWLSKAADLGDLRARTELAQA